MSEKPKYQHEEMVARIRQLLKEGNNRNKIMELTGVSDRSLRNIVHTIHEQDKIKWKEEANESLESIAFTIKNKYLNLGKVCDAIMNDDKKSPRDRIEAGKTSIACSNNIYNMVKEGPLRFNNIVTGKALEDKKDERS